MKIPLQKLQARIQEHYVTCKNKLIQCNHEKVEEKFVKLQNNLCFCVIRSPERLESKEYSYPSEIWSFGVVIYEMAEGQHPYP